MDFVIQQLCILASSCSARDETASPWLRCVKNFSNKQMHFPTCKCHDSKSLAMNLLSVFMFLKEKTMERTTKVRSFNALQPPSSRIWFKRHLPKSPIKTRDQRTRNCRGTSHWIDLGVLSIKPAAVHPYWKNYQYSQILSTLILVYRCR